MTENAASELAKKRWKNTPAKKRSEFARNISNERWEQWRRDNPEKAAASEERRRKRRLAKKKAARKAK
jgi:hypothetical protein